MMLPPIVTAEDMTRFGYDEVTEATLLRASTRVRRYTGQQITPGESTIGLYGYGPWRLPQRPVTHIDAVLGKGGEPLDHSLWDRRGQTLYVKSCAPMGVIYSHGLDPVPDVLVDLVCQIASRIAATPSGLVAGVRTEQAGAETVTWGSDAYAASSGLTDEEKEALNSMFPRWPRTVQLV